MESAENPKVIVVFRSKVCIYFGRNLLLLKLYTTFQESQLMRQ